ncbi:mismatch repair ATPase [Martiniozyma asiatica (nom. inval.)]|nr:mismatch repair ATPase [Martiniozyma asiatica]
MSDREVLFRAYLRLDPLDDHVLRIIQLQNKDSIYFRVFNGDAEKACTLIFNNSSTLKQITLADPKQLDRKVSVNYLDLTAKRLAVVLRNMVANEGYKVQLYEFEKGKLKIIKNGTPGNMDEFEELMIEDESEGGIPVIAAMLIKGNKVGLAFYLADDKCIGMCEVECEDGWENVCYVFSQLDVKECIVQEMNDVRKEEIQWKKLIKSVDGVSFTELKSFGDKHVEQTLITLTGDKLVLANPELSELLLAHQCTSALIDYKRLVSFDDVGNFKVEKYDPEQFVKLDVTAIRALNLFPIGGENKKTSLFGLLNHCKSKGGERLLSQWIKQPIVDKNEIVKRQILVEWFVNNDHVLGSLHREFLGHCPDITRLLRRIANTKKSQGIEEFIRLYQFTVKLNDGITIIQEAMGEATNETFNVANLLNQFWVDGLTKQADVLSKFRELIESTIDLDELAFATSASHNNNLIQIKEGYDDILDDLKHQLSLNMDEMQSVYGDMLDDLGATKDKEIKLEYKEQYGYVFRVVPSSIKLIRGKSSYKELQQQKSGLFMTNNELIELNQKRDHLTQQYQTQVKSIIGEIVNIAKTYQPSFMILSQLVSSLDVICSFAQASAIAPQVYNRPSEIHSLDSSNRQITIEDARHPCLEQLENMVFISNGYRQSQQKPFSLITGPNMGGKSTYIRTLGLICVMNQIGCLLPISKGEISIMDGILCRVGASDSQMKGMSTFMSEMVEMSTILKNGTTNSLIIIDELGRGTSTIDGFGIAYGICKELIEHVGGFCLFATHFHELTHKLAEDSRVVNLRVLADVDGDDVVLLYKVGEGVADQSFGINVAEIVGFPDKIVRHAKRVANELENNKRVKIDEAGLKLLLKEWKSKVEKQGGLDSMGTEDAVVVLRELVEVNAIDREL